MNNIKNLNQKESLELVEKKLNSLKLKRKRLIFISNLFEGKIKEDIETKILINKNEYFKTLELKKVIEKNI